MLSFVCWKWSSPKGYRSHFGPETVNTLKRMIDRHYDAPRRFLCVTDDAKGIDAGIEIVPDWKDYAQLSNPSGSKNPSCYRRLRMFAPDIGEVFGPRFVSFDLDVVITGDLMPLLDRPEAFVIVGDTNPRTYFNGSMVLMTAGARPQVWTTFDPVQSPKAARAAGHFGSDQGHISYCLGPKEATWTKVDGVYSFQNHLKATRVLPKDAKVVLWHGMDDPWGRLGQSIGWVREHYK